MIDFISEVGKMTTQANEGYKTKRERSPSYPRIDLENAIQRAREVYSKERMNPAPVNAILSHWGYNSKSGLGLVILAALLKFGLLADDGKGAKRQARLTELARRIILDERDTSIERDAAIKEAALNPTIHKELWEQYNGNLPSDETLRYQLRVNRGFTDTALHEFIPQLRSTVAFAKLVESDIISEVVEDKNITNVEDDMPAFAVEKDVQSGTKAEHVRYRWSLSKTTMADITIVGPNIGKKDFEMLKKYLDLTEEAFGDGDQNS